MLDKAVYSCQLNILEIRGNGNLLPVTCGPYLIISKSTKCFYVGSASGKKGFRQRIVNHYDHLRKGTHHCRRMQRHWKKFKATDFVCFLLEVTTSANAVVREQYYIDLLNAADGVYGYNTNPKADSPLGTKKSLQFRRQLSQRNKEQWKNPIYRKQRIAAMSRIFTLEKENKIYHGKNISQFAKDQAITASGLTQVLTGQIRPFHGWTLPGNGIPTNCRIGPGGQVLVLKRLIDKDGQTHEFHDTKHFAKTHKLNADCIRLVIQGKYNQHKGWTKAPIQVSI